MLPCNLILKVAWFPCEFLFPIAWCCKPQTTKGSGCSGGHQIKGEIQTDYYSNLAVVGIGWKCWRLCLNMYKSQFVSSVGEANYIFQLWRQNSAAWLTGLLDIQWLPDHSPSARECHLDCPEGINQCQPYPGTIILHSTFIVTKQLHQFSPNSLTKVSTGVAHPATQTTMLHSSFYSQRSLAIHLMDFAAFTLDYIIGVAHSAYLVTPASIIWIAHHFYESSLHPY